MGEPFDWYQRWAGLKDIFSEYIQQNHQMLVIGAGNSRLSEEMYEEGYQQMDCRAMDFPEGIFNVVIDKATLDSILCGEGSTHNAQKTLQGVSQVLGPNGVFLCV